jgi:hypothetical protein
MLEWMFVGCFCEVGSVTVTRVNDDSDGFAGIRINERFIDV